MICKDGYVLYTENQTVQWFNQKTERDRDASEQQLNDNIRYQQSLVKEIGSLA